MNLPGTVGNAVADTADTVTADIYNAFFDNATFLATIASVLLQTQKYSPRTTNKFKEEYDYIIVGAGAAGSVLANRLSEIPCVNVLLLEAGGPPNILTEVPVLGRFFKTTNMNWQYFTTPQENTGNGLVNKQVALEMGHALGGGTIWNGMIYTRGNAKDYNNWAAWGANGWSYDEVLPYFIKAENNQQPKEVDEGFHGFDGPVTVTKPPYHSKLKTAWLKAAEELNMKVVDPNGKQQWGFYDMQSTMRNGERCSAAKAYLVTVDNRTNLDIVPHAFVTKILIEDDQAVGVKFDHEGNSHIVKARKDVILSAGAINTAKLLLLSGVGPAEHLQTHGIEVKKDLPVGEGFQDHAGALVSYEVKKSLSFNVKFFSPLSLAEYVLKRTGTYTISSLVSSLVFADKDSDEPRDDPNYELYLVENLPPTYRVAYDQFHITKEVYEKVYKPYALKSTFVCYASVNRPKSRGSVTLNSTDPYDPPLVNPNYFKEEEDLEHHAKAMTLCDDIIKTKMFQDLETKPFTTKFPGCEDHKLQTIDYYKCQAKSFINTMGHPSGTARMGDPNNSTTVVDNELRVKGIEKLRVVDASVMPQIISGNLMTPVMMIAEKASDIMKKDINCQ